MSLAFLALLTPFLVRFITENKTSAINYAAPLNTSSISLNNSTVLSLGSVVTFFINYPVNIKNPRVEVLCYIDDKLVYGEAGSVAQARGDGTDLLGYNGFLLGGAGSIWLYEKSTLPADCKANLFYFGKEKGMQTYNILASTPMFHVEGKK